MEEEKTPDTAPAPAPAVAKPKKKLGQPSASEEGAAPYPKMALAQDIHKLTVKARGVDADFQAKFFEKIATELENPGLYKLLQTSLGGGGTVSEATLKEMEDKHTKHVEELEAKVEVAKENSGDMEVMEARIAIARFAAKSMTKDQALEAYKKLLDLPKVSSGKKIDAMMESSRVASFYGDQKKSADFIESVSVYGNDFLVLVS
jgi:hypothetical protein